jgi:site-specific recombinase XerC
MVIPPHGTGALPAARGGLAGKNRRRPVQARPAAQDLATALRSLFQALKQERLIFRSPTSGISVPPVVRLPVPIATDRLRRLIDRPTARWPSSPSP